MKNEKSSSLEQLRCGGLDDEAEYTVRTYRAAEMLVRAKGDEEMVFAKRYVTLMVKDMVERGYDADELYNDIAAHLNVDDLEQWLK